MEAAGGPGTPGIQYMNHREEARRQMKDDPTFKDELFRDLEGSELHFLGIGSNALVLRTPRGTDVALKFSFDYDPTSGFQEFEVGSFLTPSAWRTGYKALNIPFERNGGDERIFQKKDEDRLLNVVDYLRATVLTEREALEMGEILKKKFQRKEILMSVQSAALRAITQNEVLRIKKFIDEATGRGKGIVMEMEAADSTLSDALRASESWDEMLRLVEGALIQVVFTLAPLYANLKLAHGDLKVDNILLKNYRYSPGSEGDVSFGYKDPTRPAKVEWKGKDGRIEVLEVTDMGFSSIRAKGAPPPPPGGTWEVEPIADFHYFGMTLLSKVGEALETIESAPTPEEAQRFEEAVEFCIEELLLKPANLLDDAAQNPWLLQDTGDWSKAVFNYKESLETYVDDLRGGVDFWKGGTTPFGSNETFALASSLNGLESSDLEDSWRLIGLVPKRRGKFVENPTAEQLRDEDVPILQDKETGAPRKSKFFEKFKASLPEKPKTPTKRAPLKRRVLRVVEVEEDQNGRKGSIF